MAKLYFKYGAMGSSKSAQALITQFNYEELGMTVWLIKPSTDTRDGADVIKSRIGLERKATVITPDLDIKEEYSKHIRTDVIIADESQFFTPEQIDQLRDIVDEDRDRGQPGHARRKRQLYGHVPQMLEREDKGTGNAEKAVLAVLRERNIYAGRNERLNGPKRISD